MATLAQIKSQLGINQLELETATDLEGNKTEWLRHWDNDTRTAVSIHKDLAQELSTRGNEITSLALQHESKTGNQGPYSAFRIVKYNSNPEIIL